MSLETGKIYDGKVRNIAAYGAFVEINHDGKVYVGMVHISEVANTFVKEIKDHLKEGQEVKVKVLSTDENGKMSLSIKKASSDDAVPRSPRPQGQRNDRNGFQRNGENRGSQRGYRDNRENREGGAPQDGGSSQPPQFRQPARQQESGNSSFEDMLSRFKQSSEEKMSDLKKNMDGKRRNTKRGR
ncbi:MAG: S1 RNA-binding domain-containing protein [Oscillospiraceae bacterium]|nr:S1 RNA-binding domain-containing protein [Oscillospiraceae bacterium]